MKPPQAILPEFENLNLASRAQFLACASLRWRMDLSG